MGDGAGGWFIWPFDPLHDMLQGVGQGPHMQEGGAVSILDYECYGGPLDGERHQYRSGYAAFYLIARERDHDDDPATARRIDVIESLQKPTDPGWILLGTYQLQNDTNARRGDRVRFRWSSNAPRPVWINEEPFDIRKLLPPGDFSPNHDEESD